jgi:unsaturated rhamnogalacturonyl hydrolase
MSRRIDFGLMCASRFNAKRWVFSFALLGLALPGPASAQALPSQPQILADMTLANTYFMNKWPDPTADIVTDKTRPSNIWTRATYYEGLMALYAVDNQAAYYNYAVDWGNGHNWEPAYGGTTTRDADNQCAGQTYIELYQIDPMPERIAPIKTTIDHMVNGTKKDDWSWIDAVQMSMPVFAKLGVAYDDDQYFEKMYDIYNYTKTQHGSNGLYNTVDHLWWRDKDFDPPYTAPNGEDTYWSRGNGWVLTALARVLDVLPADAPHRNEYVTTFTEMADALVAVQRDDGFWNVSLHDPNDYGGKETSGTAFFVFGLAWGINHGLLVGDQYRDAVTDGWNGMVNDALHTDGFLGYVQSSAKQPSDGQPLSYDKVPNFEDYGLGAFLLAGSEVYQLAAIPIDPVPGDYNDDGEVNAADYTVWRNHLGAAAGTLPHDVDGGAIGQAQYDTWKTYFGTSAGAAAIGSVPEPATISLLMLTAAGVCLRRRVIRSTGAA